MLCVASLLVLGILSLFSAKYKTLAKEALDCVTRRVTLRPCTTGFDTKMKATILAPLLVKSPTFARWISKRFDVLAFGFVALFTISLLWSVRGMYLYWATGSCNGLNQSGFCAFDPTGSNNAVSGAGVECRTGGGATGDLSLANVNLSTFAKKPGNEKKLVFIGCYTCHYTKQTYPMIKKLIEQYQPTTTFLFYSTHAESKYLMHYDYCVGKLNPDKYLSWMDALYLADEATVASEGATQMLIADLGMDQGAVMACVNEPTTDEAVQRIKYEIDKTGIYGTPTVFVNDVPVVGPKPYRVYRRLLNKSLF